MRRPTHSSMLKTTQWDGPNMKSKSLTSELCDCKTDRTVAVSVLSVIFVGISHKNLTAKNQLKVAKTWNRGMATEPFDSKGGVASVCMLSLTYN